MSLFSGVIPALMTPFEAEDLRIADAALHDNAKALRDAGIEHVVVCGTMGEAGSLSREERAQVIVAARDCGLTVTVGISATDAPTAGHHARQAAELGAAGVMCLPPVLYDATEDELVDFYAAVSVASDLPIMLYNNPEAARSDMQPHTIARLAEEVERVVAVKECSGDARRIAHILELAGDDLDVLVGGDDWALEGYAAGAAGWVSGVANVAPAECLELERAVRAGDLAAARALWPRLAPLSRLDMDPRLVQSFKAALDLQGRYGGPTRPPRLPLSVAGQARVVEAMRALDAVPA
jgi:dihydrodipicolinate synthase/N-acetylneuraminate lyase